LGWGNIGLSWTRYAKATPLNHCSRCHLDYPMAEDACPHCRHVGEHELQLFLDELEKRNQKSTYLFIALIAAILGYAVVVLFVLPAVMD
jgi:predicted amidophosphoribosyltransferase